MTEFSKIKQRGASEACTTEVWPEIGGRVSAFGETANTREGEAAAQWVWRERQLGKKTPQWKIL